MTFHVGAKFKSLWHITYAIGIRKLSLNILLGMGRRRTLSIIDAELHIVGLLVRLSLFDGKALGDVSRLHVAFVFHGFAQTNLGKLPDDDFHTANGFRRVVLHLQLHFDRLSVNVDLCDWGMCEWVGCNKVCVRMHSRMYGSEYCKC